MSAQSCENRIIVVVNDKSLEFSCAQIYLFAKYYEGVPIYMLFGWFRSKNDHKFSNIEKYAKQDDICYSAPL